MIINVIGKYRLTKDWATRGTLSIAHFKAGTIIEITQIDRTGRKVIGPALHDWESWNIPVVRINET